MYPTPVKSRILVPKCQLSTKVTIDSIPILRLFGQWWWLFVFVLLLLIENYKCDFSRVGVVAWLLCNAEQIALVSRENNSRIK